MTSSRRLFREPHARSAVRSVPLEPKADLLIYNSAVPTTKDKTKKQVPVFSRERCKRCGICSHFCPAEAIGVDGDSMPYLAESEACTSCGLCSDMCPDWAVYLTDIGQAEAGSGGGVSDEAGGNMLGTRDPLDHSPE